MARLFKSKLPDNFVCPLTKDILEEPVATHDGIVFERKAIEEWLLAGPYADRWFGVSPVTGQRLPTKKLHAMPELREAIDRWLATAGDDEYYVPFPLIDEKSDVTQRPPAKEIMGVYAGRSVRAIIKRPVEMDIRELKSVSQVLTGTRKCQLTPLPKLLPNK